MRNIITPTILSAALFMTPGLALAANVHAVTGMKGQPNQTIGSAQTGDVTPGHARARCDQTEPSDR